MFSRFQLKQVAVLLGAALFVSNLNAPQAFAAVDSPALIQVEAGNSHSCAVVDGGVKCWGTNSDGKLGDGTTTNSSTPVVAIAAGSGVTAVSAGGPHSCAVVDGGVKCWGYNYNGQLGDGTTTNSSTPVVAIAADSGVTAVSAGGSHSCAVVAGGVKCWGYNYNGQLGDGTTTNSSTPVVAIAAGSGVTAVSAGSSHSCAVVDGGVKCWGTNSDGKLGDGTTTERTTPVVAIAAGSGVTAVSAGSEHSCAVVDGGVKCWGTNDSGQLAFSPNALTPVATLGLVAEPQTVTFDSKGGSSVSTDSINAGEALGEPAAPSRSGYTFQGWSATDGGSAVSFPYSPGVTEDITLYALWSADSHTVTFNSNGGSSIASGSFISGGSIDFSAPPSSRYFGDSLPEGVMALPGEGVFHLGNEVSTSVSGWVTKVYYYRYAEDSLHQSASVWSSDGVLLGSKAFVGGTASGWQSVTLDDPVYIAAGETFIVSVLTPLTPFTVGLTEMQSNSGPLSFIAVKASAPTENFVALESNTEALSLVDLQFDVASVPTPTREGFTFQGWSATDGGSAVSFPYSPGVTEDITLYAKWSTATYDVTFNSKGGSSVANGSFEHNGSLAIPYDPTRAGYSFLGWSATDGGSPVSFPYSPGVAEEITLYALWSADTHTVNLNSKGGTAVSAGSFVTGGSVTEPTAPTRLGYTFAGWSATDGGSAITFPYSPGVASNVTLYAKWISLPPVMGLTSASTLLPGDIVSLNVSRVSKGCTVTIGWTDSGLGIAPVSKVVKSDRTTGVFSIATPTTAGTYTLSTSELSAGCAGGSAVTLTRSVVVGKSLSITAKVSSSSGYDAKNPVFSVSGTVKSGSFAVSGKQVSVSLRRNGVEVQTATGITSSSGALNVVFTGTTYVAGSYTAVVTGVADSTYLAVQVTTAKLRLRSSSDFTAL